jgi:hypothetical protein
MQYDLKKQMTELKAELKAELATLAETGTGLKNDLKGVKEDLGKMKSESA